MSQPPTRLQTLRRALLAVFGAESPSPHAESTRRPGAADTLEAEALPMKTVSTVTMRWSLKRPEWGWWRRPGERIGRAGAAYSQSKDITARRGRSASGNSRARTGVGHHAIGTSRSGGGIFRYQRRAEWARRRFIQAPATRSSTSSASAASRKAFEASRRSKSVAQEHRRSAAATPTTSNRKPQATRATNRSPVRSAPRSGGQRTSRR